MFILFVVFWFSINLLLLLLVVYVDFVGIDVVLVFFEM